MKPPVMQTGGVQVVMRAAWLIGGAQVVMRAEWLTGMGGVRRERGGNEVFFIRESRGKWGIPQLAGVSYFQCFSRMFHIAVKQILRKEKRI